eukprot:TRINITY_DN242_c0_g2_i2.p1 TRINITY_DN242_c0_g2~~TRINITY_DN242_c0_g2_i2.p1  ORF type:complete len:131 (+),score=9.36 TRINITY_DN242_c0_g2_i2:365-757(+)
MSENCEDHRWWSKFEDVLVHEIQNQQTPIPQPTSPRCLSRTSPNRYCQLRFLQTNLRATRSFRPKWLHYCTEGNVNAAESKFHVVREGLHRMTSTIPHVGAFHLILTSSIGTRVGIGKRQDRQENVYSLQ